MSPADDETIRNIPASVVSDIERIDRAIKDLGEICDEYMKLGWKEAEFIFDALGDAREALLFLAEKHDKLVVRLSEVEL